MKKLSKEGLSEDMLRDAENSVQDLTNDYIRKINQVFSNKETEILKI